MEFEAIFYAQLAISVVAGGLAIAIQTLLAERFRARWRGIILTIPTTMGLGLFFVGLTKSPQDVVDVARVIPAGLGLDYIYVALYALLIRHGFWASQTAAFVIFAVGAFFIVLFPPTTFGISLAIGLGLVCGSFAAVRRISIYHSLTRFPFNPYHLAVRSIIGGVIVGLIVFLSKTLGNVWGGIFAAFPAAFTSTFVIYYLFQGRASIPAVARGLFFPGSLGFILYGITAALAFPPLGIWLGTAAAYAVTLLFYFIWSRLSFKKPMLG